MVLHTWGQRINMHPHVHAVVTAGGPSLDESRWIHLPELKQFLTAEELAERFQAIYLARLERLFRRGKLVVPKHWKTLADFQTWLLPIRRKCWQVHCQAPPENCRGPRAVLRYLARYVSGIAISNGRILSDDGETITFFAKDYRQKKRIKLRVSGDEFVRRFLFHILPLRLRRLRYYGLLAPEKCNVKLALCRRLLSAGHGADLLPFDDEPTPTETEETEPSRSAPICPRCEMPGMRHLGKLNAQELQRAEIRVQLLEERLVKVYRTDTLDPPYRTTLDTDWHVAQALGFVETIGLPLPEW